MELIIDNRESLKDYFSEKYKWVKTQNLDIGDYIFNYKDELACIIERKTVDDLANSIKDGRYREQKERLLKLHPKSKIIYLIEGDITKNNKSFKYNKVSKNTIYSSLINVYLRDNIAVHRTNNISESIEFLEQLGAKIEKQGLKFIQKSNDGNNLFNSEKSKKKQFDKKLVYKLQLSSIPSISSKSADAIIENYPTMVQLISQLNNHDPASRLEIIKNIKCKSGEKSRKLGKRVAENVEKYIFSSACSSTHVSSSSTVS